MERNFEKKINYYKYVFVYNKIEEPLSFWLAAWNNRVFGAFFGSRFAKRMSARDLIEGVLMKIK